MNYEDGSEFRIFGNCRRVLYKDVCALFIGMIKCGNALFISLLLLVISL